MRRWLKRTVWGLFCALLLFATRIAYQTCRPIPALPIDRETTYFLGPLDADGNVDYEAALNTHLRGTVTPERNIMVGLLAVFGPRPENTPQLPTFFTWLGVPEPPIEGSYFCPYERYLRSCEEIEADDRTELADQLNTARTQPWNANTFPYLAEWLRQNDAALAAARSASLRPDYYHPLVTRRENGHRQSLLSASISYVRLLRRLGLAFSARAMFHLDAGQLDDAWDDLMTFHRLARGPSRGGTMIEGLASYALDRMATEATATFLTAPGQTPERIARAREAWERLPAIAPLADTIQTGERLLFLGVLDAYRAGHLESVSDEKTDWIGRRTLQRYDWTPAYRAVNQHYDRLASICRLPNRTERQAAFSELNAELLVKETPMAPWERWTNSERTRVERIANTFFGLMTPALQKVLTAKDRQVQNHTLLSAAFTLARTRVETGKYPETYEVPDLFSGKPCIYVRTETGYLLYSVGANEVDEGAAGKTDDVWIRVP